MDATGSSPDTTETGQGTSPNAPATDAPPTQRKAGKRDRVALACQRCKTRKQKVVVALSGQSNFWWISADMTVPP